MILGGAIAILLSAGAAFSYLHSMGYAAGDLIGLRGREGDVAFAQRWATVWLLTAVGCLGASSLACALATPIYEDAGRLSQLIARLVVGLVVSFVLAVLIGFISFSIITPVNNSLSLAGVTSPLHSLRVLAVL